MPNVHWVEIFDASLSLGYNIPGRVHNEFVEE